ncbi:Flp pilus assembly protein TadB [Chelatococcus asaccharovorans]|uniref:Tight adherence protein B n=2 Tax=Chelatococcus asaccharovorans TaxID=28210 RepID=A0A2V3U9Q3_9HYPH|nr:type II secretion system F family protein [Chelatococcus asaccharovorans]MBS7704828.1 type II secretion system F family protein [Chelatococcus asaccharovorans]PXW54725.1 tight adherence protein B [Chelatococcus asaccharovorans]CAH1650465.1 Flp pilus assembly protein TadB [Chelatococcus asaccharovorans]CAH1686760.1 Flp pilus assembly protein TadB [Chelatococcus asaccharovorans]
MTIDDLFVIVLSTVATGATTYALVFPYISSRARAAERQKTFVAPPAQRAIERANGAANRRDQIAQSLKDLEARQKAKHRVPLETRLARAGLPWSRKRFFMASVIVGIVVGILLGAASGNPWFAAGGLFVGTFGLPRWILSYLTKRRINRFIAELPNALDIIVRGIRAGLPVGDCLKIIGSEAAEPVRSEFRAIVEAQVLGMPVADAVGRLPERIPAAEANFFAIVIAVQQQSGGSLSEALGNLSRVLRERRKMKGKITAMSMEAKASAAIIGALPFVVTALVYLTSPRYIAFLWTTNSGMLALAASALWMTIGILVMKKMISFDI